jgi:hypothetical protein
VTPAQKGYLTRTSNHVKSNIAWMLETPAKWNLAGDKVKLDYVGLPSWWPFWSDNLKAQVIELCRLARQLEDQ